MENTILYGIDKQEPTYYNAKLVFRVYNVILCDDDVLFLSLLKERVAKTILKNNIKAKIYTYTAMEEISDQILKTCDIAILDIDFSGKNYSGLDIARHLREFRTDAVIIFATNYIEYAPEGYEVQAFRYILKSEISQKLEGYLEPAFAHLQASSETIKFQINGEIVSIPLEHILYIEAQLHTVKVLVQSKDPKNPKEYIFYSSIGKLEQQLSEKGFLRIHKSYLVNMAHIRQYQCRKVLLDNGKELNASANRYSEQKERYLVWKGLSFNG